MILLQGPSRALQHTLHARLRSLDRGVEIDYHLVEFDDVRYHIYATAKEPHHLFLSISIPPPPPETVFSGGLPFGATEAVRGAYGGAVQVMEATEPGFHLTLRLDLTRLPADEGERMHLVTRLASLRSVVLGAPLRKILKHLAAKQVDPDADSLTSLVHRPKESYFVIPQPEKVIVVFPMRFKDGNDVILATSFLQEFMEARRTAGLNTAPLCKWSPTPPLELKGAPPQALDANSGFMSFVIFPRHVEGPDSLDRVVWSLSTFHAYVGYHIKCSKAFMHTRMRRRVDILIQAFNRAKPEGDPTAVKERKTAQGRSFKRSV